MAIKGLTEVIDSSDMAPGGWIRMGRKNDRGHPVASSHFIFDPVDPSVGEAFVDTYGKEPTSIRVMFASDDPDEVFPHAYKAWRGGRLWCEGDNETATQAVDLDKKQYKSVACNDQCPFRVMPGVQDKTRICKPEGVLHFRIPDISSMRVYRLRTHRVGIGRVLGFLRFLGAMTTRIFGEARYANIVITMSLESIVAAGMKVKTIGFDLGMSMNQLRDNVATLQTLDAPAAITMGRVFEDEDGDGELGLIEESVGSAPEEIDEGEDVEPPQGNQLITPDERQLLLTTLAYDLFNEDRSRFITMLREAQTEQEVATAKWIVMSTYLARKLLYNEFIDREALVMIEGRLYEDMGQDYELFYEHLLSIDSRESADAWLVSITKEVPPTEEAEPEVSTEKEIPVG